MKMTRLLIVLFLISLLCGCQSQPALTLVRTNASTVRFSNNSYLSNYYLDASGNFYASGTYIESDETSADGHYHGMDSLTQKQQDLVPAIIKQYVNEENQLTGIYNYRLISTNVVDYNTDGGNPYFLTSAGKLYSWKGKDNISKKMGITPGENDSVLLAENVIKLCPTYPLSFILEDGSLIVTANEEEMPFYAQIEGAEEWIGSCGQVFTKVAENAYDAAGLVNHNLAYIDLQGDLYICGYNDFGLLGNGKYDEVLAKQYVTYANAGNELTPEGYSYKKFYKVLSDVTKIQIEIQNAFAWRSDGSVWVWGANEYGQCGLGSHGDGYANTREVICKPKKLLENCVKLFGVRYSFSASVCENGFLALTGDGRLLGWGSNATGLLGNGQESLTTDEYLPIDTPQEILNGVKDFTYSNGVQAYTVLKENGDVYCWGYSFDGSAGVGIRAPGYPLKRHSVEYANFTPAKILEDGYLLSERCTNVSVIKKDGTVWSWGDNPFGYNVNHGYVDQDRINDSTYAKGILVIPVPTKNPYISAVISADGTVSFVPTPVE